MVVAAEGPGAATTTRSSTPPPARRPAPCPACEWSRPARVHPRRPLPGLHDDRRPQPDRAPGRRRTPEPDRVAAGSWHRAGRPEAKLWPASREPSLLRG